MCWFGALAKLYAHVQNLETGDCSAGRRSRRKSNVTSNPHTSPSWHSGLPSRRGILPRCCRPGCICHFTTALLPRHDSSEITHISFRAGPSTASAVGSESCQPLGCHISLLVRHTGNAEVFNLLLALGCKRGRAAACAYLKDVLQLLLRVRMHDNWTAHLHLAPHYKGTSTCAKHHAS